MCVVKLRMSVSLCTKCREFGGLSAVCSGLWVGNEGPLSNLALSPPTIHYTIASHLFPMRLGYNDPGVVEIEHALNVGRDVMTCRSSDSIKLTQTQLRGSFFFAHPFKYKNLMLSNNLNSCASADISSPHKKKIFGVVYEFECVLYNHRVGSSYLWN